VLEADVGPEGGVVDRAGEAAAAVQRTYSCAKDAAMSFDRRMCDLSWLMAQTAMLAMSATATEESPPTTPASCVAYGHLTAR
jgi:hypothetical protein